MATYILQNTLPERCTVDYTAAWRVVTETERLTYAEGHVSVFDHVPDLTLHRQEK